MRILVTGAAGFIGAHVCKQLVADGHAVVGLDNFNDYYDVQLKRDRVAALCPEVPIVTCDLADAAALSELFANDSFAAVCHLAASAGVRYSLDEPAAVIQNNVTATTTLLETMRAHAVPRIVFASSSSVYGNDTQSPFTEAASAVQPVSVYGASKRADELLLHTYYALYGIEATCFRFFTVYGPWSRPDMAMLKFAKRMVAGESIDVYNQGDLRRDFTHIDDIVAGFVAGVEQPCGYEIFNLGRGQATELKKLITLLEANLEVTATKQLLPMQPGDVYETYANTDKAATQLGYRAQVDVETGIQSFTDWFRSYYPPTHS